MWDFEPSRGGRGALLLTMLAGCGSGQPSAVPSASAVSVPLAPVGETSVAAGEASGPAARSPTPWPLVVAGPEGLVAVDERGKPVTHLTATPAEAVRIGPGGDLWFLSRRGGALELRHLKQNGAERVVASIHNHFDHEACSVSPASPARATDHTELHLHEASDFIVSPTSACVLLSDRNVNMRSLSVSTEIQLASGELAQVEYAPDCGKGGDAPFCASPSQQSSTVAPEVASHAYRYDESVGAVLRVEDELNVFSIQGTDQRPASVVASSASGALLMLRAFRAQGDYMHWTPVLLDLRTGFAVGFRNEAGTIVAVSHGSDPATEPFDVVTETQIFFVDERRAVIDDRLIALGPGPLQPDALPRVIELPGLPAPSP